MSDLDIVRANALSGLPHAFLGRRGGVSRGAMWGLNMGYGSGDDPALIIENRARGIAALLPGASIATVHQIHSGDAVRVEIPWPETERPRADAMVTDRPGVLLGILTADCAPVLFADVDAGIVGAAHAGWRGAFAGVTDATIVAMEKLGARRDRIAAAVGPCIAQQSYEVDAGFRDRFIAEDSATDRFFQIGPSGKPHFDLEAYVAARLASAGIAWVETLNLDTYADSDRFYSYRRSTHNGEPIYGRQMAMIGLRS